MSSLKQEAAHWQRKSALTNYLPKISAVGTYQHTFKEVQLLSSEQKQKLSHLGTNMSAALGQGFQQGSANFLQAMANLPASPEFQALMQNPQAMALIQQHPSLLQLMGNPTLIQQLATPFLQQASTAFNSMLTSMATMVDGAGQREFPRDREETGRGCRQDYL